MNVVKGAVHIIARREFVEFAVTDHRALDFLHWLKDAAHPDEMFFSSLNYNKHLAIPGGYLGK